MSTRTPVLAVDGTAYGDGMTGAARRTRCLLPRLAARGWRPLLLLARAHAAAWKDLDGVALLPLAVPRRPGPMRHLATRGAAPPLLAAAGCQLLLTEIPPPPARLPFVLTVHDTRTFDAPELLAPGRRLWSRLTLPPALRRAAAVVTVSHWSAERLRAHFPACEPRLVPNGCDHLPLVAATPAAPPFLLAVGPWGRHKGLDVLLDAHARLRASAAAAARPLPDLVLAGEPPPCALPAGVRVERADDPALAGLLAQAAVVVRPSLFEGFDLPLGEALRAGARVVASDLPVHRELAGGAARYYAPEDPAALAAALDAALAEHARGEPPPPAPPLPNWDDAATALDAVLREVLARADRR